MGHCRSCHVGEGTYYRLPWMLKYTLKLQLMKLPLLCQGDKKAFASCFSSLILSIVLHISHRSEISWLFSLAVTICLGFNNYVHLSWHFYMHYNFISPTSILDITGSFHLNLWIYSLVCLYNSLILLHITTKNWYLLPLMPI